VESGMSVGTEMKAEKFAEASVTGIGAVPDLEFTGERIVPGKVPEALFREHEERYVFAGQHVAGKDVLDIACGTGIGTDYLRKTGAARCWGIDIDPVAVAYAQAMYEDCTFARGDATQIGLPDNSVDVVVSFETIEHVSDQPKFLAECDRVLRPGGLFICSTPNRLVSRWWEHNSFHVNELTETGFAKQLRDYFEDVCLYGQDPKLYPLHVLRVLMVRGLTSLGIKSLVKSLLCWGESPLSLRSEFGAASISAMEAIQPLRETFFRKCSYIVGIGRKNNLR
jgi:SAM-dependent methyltransferase